METTNTHQFLLLQISKGKSGGLAGIADRWRRAFILAVASLIPLGSLLAKEASSNEHLSTHKASAAGIPSLDEMAGDWIPMKDVANPPAVHNFNQMLVVDHDLTSFFCYPGGLYPWRHGYPIVKLAVDGQEYPATETRCFAYRALRRNLECDGLAVETDTRMVNEQRGVLCRITATTTTAKPLKAALTLRVPGELQADGVGVANDTQRTNVVSVVRPSRKPDAVTTEEETVCWTWTSNCRRAAK